MPRIADDPTIHVGLHLYDATDYDTVVERVEYGGFGVIAFGPNRLNNGQIVAYKTLRRELLNEPQTRAGFVRECLLWVGLWGHANVAVAYAAFEMWDEIGERPFLALEYADRGSLRTLLQDAQRQPGGRLPLDLALYVAQQIAAGLAYLHRLEPEYLRTEPTVHRDLKPENVLLKSDGRVVITDFGLAKAVKESPVALALLLSQQSVGQPGRQAEEAILLGGEEVTRTAGLHTAAGVALGTVPYMPPEQWEDARHVGPAADIYALGIMLSELLAGRHALLDLNQPHTQAAWRQAHQNPQPRPLREVSPEIPPVIENIYRRCLALDPVDRPLADEVLAALQTGAQVTGLPTYEPHELVPHTTFNEWVHWHMWSIAYLSFGYLDEALERSDRALAIARQLWTERPSALPATLLTRGTILKALGQRAWDEGREAAAKEIDRQAEAAYQESLATCAPLATAEGRQGRANVWHQIGVFNDERKRFDYADDAYARALTFQPDNSNTYYNRTLNQRDWGMAELRAGRREAAIAHLRQARVYAVTILAMGHPTAASVLQSVNDILRQLGVTDGA